MGITPITNLTPLPIVPRVEMELGSPIERVENSTRTGDETYSPSEGRSADSDDEMEEQTEEQAADEEVLDAPEEMEAEVDEDESSSEEESSLPEDSEESDKPPTASDVPIANPQVNFFA